jgi:hypothetical protein
MESEETDSNGSPVIDRASTVQTACLGCSALLGLIILIFWGGFFGAIQRADRGHSDFQDPLLEVHLLGGMLPAAKLAFHLNMRTFGERFGELRELAEHHATMPFRVGDILAVLLVGGLGCQRESCEAAGVANFCVAAEKTDERYFVLIDESISVLNSPVVARVTVSEAGEWARLPSAEGLLSGGTQTSLQSVLY